MIRGRHAEGVALARQVREGVGYCWRADGRRGGALAHGEVLSAGVVVRAPELPRRWCAAGAARNAGPLVASSENKQQGTNSQTARPSNVGLSADGQSDRR